MILIGSRALAFRAPFLLKRQPKDFDFIADESEANAWIKQRKPSKVEEIEGKIIAHCDGVPCEFELIKKDYSSSLLKELVESDSDPLETPFGLVPNLNLLFTIKSSHKYLKNSIFFWKTACDYHLMKMAGAKILPEYKPFLKLREKETYTYKHPKLHQSKKNFFADDNVTYKYDHDSIHEAMKHLDRPAYTYFQKDGAEVQCDKEKFFSLPMKTRLYATLEESYVLALERSQIPHPGALTPKQSFKLALSKTASSITSGWFRKFSFDNIFTVLKMYDDNYVERFKQALEKGIIKKI